MRKLPNPQGCSLHQLLLHGAWRLCYIAGSPAGLRAAFDQGGTAAAGETIAASEAEIRPHIDLRTGGQQSGQQGPLTIDHRIIDQLGCIIISRTRIDDAYKNIMNKFKEIIKEASAMVKIGKGVGE